MKYGARLHCSRLHSDQGGYCILLGQPLVLQGKIKCLPPPPTPISAFWPGHFYEPVSTNRFKRAFTNLTENILLVDAQKVQTDFCSLFLKSPNLPEA